ncbi:hypothetical protein [Bifidobacterium simiiventris]|uniref:hypothetical protein n=1 Tax=Bifidobacterium simiiventris TaxID=2834434 RepID=UPI001C585372|nr:hypothetical protein [Bifidobacterium simiiventris]MBW3077795.1 hypothetical protein [Bifidobacterium simiiventris]
MPYIVKRIICFLTGLAVESFDVSLVIIAGVMSLVFFGRIDGLGLGTVVAAVITGQIVNLINRHCWFVPAKEPVKVCGPVVGERS